ncbi:helix-turn-helix transcriptional regulator [Streptomyces sp. ISL-36]|uniref:ArsR/SmtB family transcription factor n=1 Tax=Streptomyces sp. ISL-36 TaxID=2819182 RepID=UPI001BE73EBE|nr:helix-turn-helix domain-containing protein [Streptomyces sp. ISL-36]MBT2439695.1 helix-turn-helix transcriptional regulator [Streptomyces sp. ISL-36]
MKRIHFTADDLARTRVVPTIGAAAETSDSFRLLNERDDSLAFRRWRAALPGRLGERARPLAALMPPRGAGVDIASLAGFSSCIEEAADTFLSAPRALMRIELAAVDFRPADRAWARLLADGDRDARLQVVAALRACHRVTVAPFAAQIRSHLDAIRSAYARDWAEDGVERLLADLCRPLVRWRAPVLEVRHPRDEDVHLGGRGLLIAPTMFSSQQVELLHSPLEPDRAPVLAVPTVGDTAVGNALWDGREDGEESLGELLGRTRAAALRATADGCNTTELARRLDISLAAASHHTAVLRKANLITTSRQGKAVLHVATALGTALLQSHRRLA